MENLPSQNKFKIAETATFQKSIKHSKKIYEKIQNIVYPQLKANPFFGPNIKKLHPPLAPMYRYRIGNHRLFYHIEKSQITVFIIDLKQRKEAY